MSNKQIIFLYSSAIILILWGYADLIAWFNDIPSIPEFTIACAALIGFIVYESWREYVEFKHSNRSFKDVTRRGIEWNLRRKGYLIERRIEGERNYEE